MAAIQERIEGPDLILFVHGLGCAKESFSTAWDSHVLEDYSLLAPDLPGHGDTPLDPWGCRMEDYATFLKSVVVARRWKRLHVVAHSMGGAAALLLDRFEGLPLSSFINVEGNLIAEDCALLSRRAAESRFKDFLEQDFNKLLAKAAQADDKAVRAWAEWSKRCDPKAYHGACKSLVAWSDSGKLLDRYKKLTVPKAYIYGEKSANPAVLKKLDGERCIQIDGAGHFIMQERPNVFFRLIAKIIGEATPPPGSD